MLTMSRPPEEGNLHRLDGRLHQVLVEAKAGMIRLAYSI